MEKMNENFRLNGLIFALLNLPEKYYFLSVLPVII